MVRCQTERGAGRATHHQITMRGTSRWGNMSQKSGMKSELVCKPEPPAYCAVTRQNFGLPDGNGRETTCGSLVCKKDCVVSQLVVLREAIC